MKEKEIPVEELLIGDEVKIEYGTFERVTKIVERPDGSLDIYSEGGHFGRYETGELINILDEFN